MVRKGGDGKKGDDGKKGVNNYEMVKRGRNR